MTRWPPGYTDRVLFLADGRLGITLRE